MVLYEFPNMSAGPDNFLVDLAVEVSTFVPMFLVFVFMTILIGGATTQKRRVGSADIPMWSTLSSIATLMIALALSMQEGLMNYTWLGIVVAVTIISGIWLFLTHSRTEV